MKKYKIVSAHFHTGEKKYYAVTARNLQDLENKLDSLREKEPYNVVAAYLDSDLQLILRPHQMMLDKELVKEDKMHPVEFMLAWDIKSFGIDPDGGISDLDQKMPDISLPKRVKKEIPAQAALEDPIPSAAGA